MPLVYVVDDDPVTCEAITAVLEPAGHELRTFTRPAEVLEAATTAPPAVTITDFAMPGMNGLELVDALRRVSPDTTFLVVSGQATVEDAVELMKHGVVDVMVKPPRARALRRALALALSQHRLAAENRRLREALRAHRSLSGVIGASPAFEKVLRLVEKVAPTDTTVLLTGETGTGKEVIADAIHELSRRADRPLVKVHCAAIPATLLEAQLFGHVRGAFTGAVKDRHGFFEEAGGGTLFLDEIGEISQELQTKLLRVLQTGEVQRLGESQPRHVDVRVIAATNRDLEQEVREGRFREDLFYRLHVIPIEIPPLRSRGDDVLLLARHFFDRERERQGRDDLRGLSADAVAVLRAWDWPGNVRELENVLQRAVTLAEGPEITATDLPDRLRAGTTTGTGAIEITADMTLRDAERVLILATLERCGGNRKEAAARLGISQATLYRKLAQYGAGETDAP